MQPNIEILVDTVVSVHPKRIRHISEIDEILLKIDVYEKKVGVPAGVIVTQNRQLGGSCRIESESEAFEKKANPGVCEWGVTYYPRSYFEELKKKLKIEYQH